MFFLRLSFQLRAAQALCSSSSCSFVVCAWTGPFPIPFSSPTHPPPCVSLAVLLSLSASVNVFAPLSAFSYRERRRHHFSEKRPCLGGNRHRRATSAPAADKQTLPGQGLRKMAGGLLGRGGEPWGNAGGKHFSHNPFVGIFFCRQCSLEKRLMPTLPPGAPAGKREGPVGRGRRGGAGQRRL